MNYKVVEFDNFFKFERGKRLIKVNQIEGDIAYISSSKTNNGISNYINPPEYMKVYNNVITLSNSGSVGYVFYHDYDIVASDHVTVIWIDSETIKLNKYIALFLKPILESLKSKYNFGREISNDRLKKEKIVLPMKTKDLPDWKFMESEAKKIEKNIVFKKIHFEMPKFDLNTENWELIKLSDYFDAKRGTRLVESERIAGEYPFITAGFKLSGFSQYIGNDDIETHNRKLTIDMFGNCFYRDYEFKCDDNIIVLYEKKPLSKYVKMFIEVIINLDKFRHGYGRQYRLKHFKQQKILLPIKNRSLDTEIIEKYMKKIPYISKI